MSTVKKEDTVDVEDGKSTSVRYVSFSGKGSSFMEWKIKTLSLARKKKFDTYFTKEWKDRKSTRLNSSHSQQSRMPSSA